MSEHSISGKSITITGETISLNSVQPITGGTLDFDVLYANTAWITDTNTTNLYSYNTTTGQTSQSNRCEANTGEYTNLISTFTQSFPPDPVYPTKPLVINASFEYLSLDDITGNNMTSLTDYFYVRMYRLGNLVIGCFGSVAGDTSYYTSTGGTIGTTYFLPLGMRPAVTYKKIVRSFVNGVVTDLAISFSDLGYVQIRPSPSGVFINGDTFQIFDNLVFVHSVI